MFERYSYPSRQVIFLSRVIAAHAQAQAIEASHLTGALIIGDQGIRIAERLGAASFDLSYLFGFKRPMWPSLLTRELADALLDSVGLRFSMPHLPTSEDIPVSEEVSSVFGAAAALPRAGEAVEPDHLWLGLLREGSLSAHLRNANSSDEKFEKLLRDHLSAIPPISVQDIEKAATAALTQEDIEDERKNWDL